MAKSIIKELPFIDLFESFIRVSSNGRRLKKDGKRIKQETIDNYGYALKQLKSFEAASGKALRIRPVEKLNSKLLTVERNYWKRFHKNFTDHMYKQGCHDNYTGSILKCIRSFFNHLEKDRSIPVGKFHLGFYVVQQEVPIITLLPDQLRLFIYDKAFETGLTPALGRSKDIFVVGCTVALRFGDMMAIGWKNIEMVGDKGYLCVQSQKSETVTRVKLTAYVLEVLEKYRRDSRGRKTIFPALSLFRFNENIRRIVELAGHTHEVGKYRNRQGVPQQQLHPKTGRPYRFCDLVSSHIMRRTAITTMLMHGVAELTVKKISGHTGNSKAFYRYVNLVQSYMNAEVDKHIDKMALLADVAK